MLRRLSKRLSRQLAGDKLQLEQQQEEERREEHTALAISLNNEVVRFQGVSLRFLSELLDDLLAGRAAPGIELFVALESLGEHAPAGSTLRLSRRLTDDLWGGVMRHPSHRVQFHPDKVRPKPRSEWDVEDVCTYLILPETIHDKSIYLECLHGTKDLGPPFRGTFLSQARKTGFETLIRGVLAYYADRDPRVTYVWIDIFGANQPLLTLRDKDLPSEIQIKREALLSNALHQAINAFDERLLFFDSWSRPTALSRLWCIWEIFGAIKDDKDLKLAFAEGEEERFVAMLRSGGMSRILELVSNMDTRSAECFDPDDKAHIIAEVEEQLERGFSTLNELVVGHVRRWLVDSTRQAVKSDQRQSKVRYSMGPAKAKSREHAELLYHAGEVLQRFGEPQEATDHFFEALETAEKIGDGALSAQVHVRLAAYLVSTQSYSQAEEHLSKAIMQTTDTEMLSSAYRVRGEALYRQGRYSEALEVCRDNLKRLERKHGQVSHQVAEAFFAIALQYDGMGDFSEALANFLKSADIYRQSGYHRHPELARAYNAVGDEYRMMGDYANAAKFLQMAYDLRLEVLGFRNLDTATSCNNLALLYQETGDFDKAHAFFDLAVQSRMEVNPDDSGIADVYCNRANTYGFQAAQTGDPAERRRLNEQALKFLDLDLEITERQEGKFHIYVSANMQSRGVILTNCGRYEEGLEALDRALDIRRRVKADNNPILIAETLHSRAIALFHLGRREEALVNAHEAREIYLERLEEGHKRIASLDDTIQEISSAPR